MKKETTIKKIEIGENIVYFANTKKFKSFIIGCTFFGNLENHGNEEKNVLVQLMSKKTKTYPDEQHFLNHLKDLYNMRIVGYMSKMGLTTTINFTAGTVNSKYLNTKINLFFEALNVLKDVIQNPYFDENSLEIEKKLLINDIDSIYNNKTQYANRQFLKTMFPNELISTSLLNDKDIINQLSIENLKKAYDEILTWPRIFYVIGDINEEELENLNSIQLPKSQNINLEFLDTEVKEFDEPTVVVEELPINQSILNIGYRTEIRLNDSEYDAIFICNAMLGQYFHSSLFQIIREKHGLAYYIGSDYNPRKGNMAISCAIDDKKFDKTVNLIKEIIESYQKGEIDEENLKLTKLAIINQLLKSEDEAGSIFTKVLSHYSGNKISTIEEKKRRINNITKKDIQEVAKKMRLDTIYFLKGNRQNEENTE